MPASRSPTSAAAWCSCPISKQSCCRRSARPRSPLTTPTRCASPCRTYAFLAMEARHCAGAEMQDMMAYAASVGSDAAKREGAKGFIGNANDLTAHWFGAPRGYGTMPHSLVGYAGSTLRAAEMLRDLPRRTDDRPRRLLRPRSHRRIRCLCAVPRTGAVRASVVPPGHACARFMEGLDPAESYAVLERKRPERSAGIAARPNCASLSAPACPPPPSGACAKR